MEFKVFMIEWLTMVTEEQKYFSGIFRNLGFAALAPIGSIIFQTVVFKKPLLDTGYPSIALIISAISCLLFYLGYIYIKERKK